MTLREKYTLTGHNPRILTLAFTADGKNLVSAGGSGLLSFWSIADTALLKEIPAHGKGLGVRSIDIDAGGRIVSGGGDGEIKLWTMVSDDPLSKFPNENGRKRSARCCFQSGREPGRRCKCRRHRQNFRPANVSFFLTH